MMRQTGGCAVGEISTRSRFFSRAILRASNGGIMPICWPSSPITRISRARIRSLIRIKRLSIQPSRKAKKLSDYSMWTSGNRAIGGAFSRVDSLSIASLLLQLLFTTELSLQLFAAHEFCPVKRIREQRKEKQSRDQRHPGV